LESGFERDTPDSFKVQQREGVSKMNSRPWSITLKQDHSYSLPGEEGKWSIEKRRLLLTALKQGGKKLKHSKRQAYNIAASGRSFGLRLTKFFRLDFTRSTPRSLKAG